MLLIWRKVGHIITKKSHQQCSRDGFNWHPTEFEPVTRNGARKKSRNSSSTLKGSAHLQSPGCERGHSFVEDTAHWSPSSVRHWPEWWESWHSWRNQHYTRHKKTVRCQESCLETSESLSAGILWAGEALFIQQKTNSLVGHDINVEVQDLQ